ncbi:AT-hook motif nuclear-localized protein 17 [Linum perenne]
MAPRTSPSPYILELPTGSDLIDSISRFSRRRNLGLCVLTRSGTVSNVTLRRPSTTALDATVPFHGRFDILSVSGTFSPNPADAPLPDSFTEALDLAVERTKDTGNETVAETLVVLCLDFLLEGRE